MEHYEANILDLATQDFIVFPSDVTVEQAREDYRTVAKGKDVILCLYILESGQALAGCPGQQRTSHGGRQSALERCDD